MKDILIIEDNRDMAEGLRVNLEMEGYAVRIAEDGRTGLDSIRTAVPDLLVLDLMLPGPNGYEVLRSVRAEGIDCPVLILSARDRQTDKLLGFRAGADDYVVKPFGLLEVLARVTALLRRTTRGAEDGVDRLHSFGDVQVDLDAKLVRRGGEVVSLTPRAFDLLEALLAKQGGVATRSYLLKEVWGFPSPVQTRTIDAHIAELRKKLEPDPTEPRHILTVWKRGYRLHA